MSRKWSDLSRGQQRAVVIAGTVQIALATAAWVDLARRPAEEVNGSKAMWAAIIAINFVGPVAYFARGRRTPLMSDLESLDDIELDLE
ncbi:membrane protein [Intrasporangium oryzae NRRL B-24470]|uniref:Membrane protein n=1 Tax=Intrasporangium oryzae NRRL B-24470 TaxID=1386089 RepID=W9G305_9MICO|nr:PLD nuclease N-terminal domain-containing protein [Intrasporangium oryzae]EWT00385.1 membrane protein [Intrasporangium oryzae NRRL B-24470]